VIVGIIRRKPVLTYASIIFGGMLASVNSVKKSTALKVLDNSVVAVVGTEGLK